MNGYTPTTPQEIRIANLLNQVPQEYRARATRECYGENDHEFERMLTGYVIMRVWETYEHPVNEAEIFTDSFADERIDNLNSDIAITVAKRNIEICHPADREYFQNRLEEEIQKSNRYW